MPATLIPFALPVSRPVPPTGDAWFHEVKFDGWRLQVHKLGRDVALLVKRHPELRGQFSMSRDTLLSWNGNELTSRFPQVAAAVKQLKSRALVLDGEVVTLDDDGRPNFTALLRLDAYVVLYAFDALKVGTRDLRSAPLTKRRAQLAKLLADGDGDVIRISEVFDDPVALLSVLEPLGIEGIVSKRRNAPYRTGTRSGWVKFNAASWREANTGRRELFAKRR